MYANGGDMGQSELNGFQVIKRYADRCSLKKVI